MSAARQALPQTGIAQRSVCAPGDGLSCYCRPHQEEGPRQRIGVVSLFAFVLALNPPNAFAGDRPVVVAGAGKALLTDPDLNLEALGVNIPPRGGEYPLAFALAGVVRADGTASGTAEFVFGRDFSF